MKDKIVENNIVIHPIRGKKERSLPPNGMLLVNPSEAQPRITKTIQGGGRSQKLFNAGLCVAGSPPYFLAGPSIGAPMAVMTLEKLIVLGARKIILCGWCGGIDPSFSVGDIVVPDRGLIGEGTSPYYTDSPCSHPAKSLSETLVELLSSHGQTVNRGCIWSTDAIFREERTQLQSLSVEHGVVGVDMEFSALCSVAAFRGVELCAMLVVSDEVWGKSWKPGFSKQTFLTTKESVLNILQDNISHF